VFTFNSTPTTDRDELRIIIGDIAFDNGPAPDHANVDDATLDHFLSVGGDINGAAVLAFEHLAALWISRPIFGPGELSTIHTRTWEQFMKMAEEYRSRSADPDVSGAVVTVGSFTRVDGYTDSGSEYTA
jgi:hypothetical protein